MRMKDYFVYKNHLFICSELLSLNLYEKIKQNEYKGFSPNVVRILARQILEAMAFIRDKGIIHCDMKPENILFAE